MPTPGFSALNQFYGGNQLQNLFQSYAPPPIVQTPNPPANPPASTPAQAQAPSNSNPATTTPAIAAWDKGTIRRQGQRLGNISNWGNPISATEAATRVNLASPYYVEQRNQLLSQYGLDNYYAPGNANMWGENFAGNATITPWMERSLEQEFVQRGMDREAMLSFLQNPVAWTGANAPHLAAITGDDTPSGQPASFNSAGLINLLTEAVQNLGYDRNLIRHGTNGEHYYGLGGFGSLMPLGSIPNITAILSRLGLA